MKRVVLMLTCLMLAYLSNAQAPEAFKYQAVIRDNAGVLLVDQSMDLQIDIIEESINGSPIYSESHSAMTNSYGMITLEIGSGTTMDDFSMIEWGSNTYFLKLWVNGSEMGTSQLLSVPYALHSGTADSILNFSIEETDPVFGEWDKDYRELNNSPDISDSIDTYAVLLKGDQKIDGNKQFTGIITSKLNADSSIITNVSNPVQPGDAVNKRYTDSLETALSKKDSIYDELIDYLVDNDLIPRDVFPGYGKNQGIVIDPRDSTEYNWVKIGNQIWMADNLAYLPQVNNAAIGSERAEYEFDKFYYVFNHWTDDVEVARTSSYYKNYGTMYNWYAAIDVDLATFRNLPEEQHLQGACPAGWHLPSQAEWEELNGFLVSEGHTLKEADLYGFSALPGGGMRWYAPGGVNNLGIAYLWGRDEISTDNVFSVTINSGNLGSRNKNAGQYIRCLKD